MKRTAISLALIAGLSACGGGNSNSDSDGTTNPVTTDPSASDETNTNNDSQQTDFPVKQVVISVNNPDNSSLTLEFNRRGKLISAIDAGGRDSGKDVYSYDAQNRIQTITEDYGNNGSNDSQTSFRYNDNSQLTSREVDNAIDGGIDSVLRYSYNAQGQQTGIRLDSGGDQVDDNIETLTYTASGKISTRTVDTNGDGDINRSYTYNYNADDLLDRKVRAGVNDIFTFTYNDQNQLTSESIDFNGNTTIDRQYNYQYDDNGRVVRKEEVEAGVQDRTEVFGYDQYNNITSLQVIRPNMENLDVAYTYTATDFENNPAELTISIADHLKDEIFIDTPVYDGFFHYRSRMTAFGK